MLKRLRVNNFKSLVNVEFRPAGVNVFIGPNNSGKTNLCKATQFLGLTATGSLQDAIQKTLRESWNITNAYSGGNLIEIEVDCLVPCEGNQLEFNYRLQIAAQKSDPLGKQSLEVAKEVLKLTGGEFRQMPLLERERASVEALDEVDFLRGPEFCMQFENRLRMESGTTALNQICASERFPHTVLFKRYLQSWAYYSLNPAALRSSDVSRSKPGLLADGSNLCATMFRLHNEKPRLEKQIIEIVKALEPKFDLLSYSFPDPESVFMFVEDQEGHRFGTQSISDGTLRFMAMTYLILSAAERDENEPPPLIIIEEPENGLYVGHLKPLIERIDKDGKGGQFIFTTHSPYFIDLFDGMLEGVHVMKPGKPSSVLTKPDPDRIRELLKQMPLGELHFREMLG
jgi:predicted ATPase